MSDFYWDIRQKHLYIPGMSGYGKTSLMANLAIDDILYTNDPVIVIDPKGSKQGLVNRIIPHIPRHLVHKVRYLSLRHPVPIDMMNARTPFEKNLIKSDIATILKRFASFGSWGSTMQGVLNHLVPTLLEAQDTTFLDIGHFLESKKRRDAILEQVSDERQAYWKENPPLKADIGPLSMRMSNFYEPPLSTIVSGKRGEGLNIAEIIDENQILLVDTSPNSEDGLMLGALIMSRIQQAIFRRGPEHDHPCCHVYADEFQNFITSAFNVMLSESRSFNLSLCMANQHPKQIAEIWDDVIGNVSTYVIFRMDGTHAAMFKGKITEPEVLARIPHLGVGYALHLAPGILPDSIQCPAPPDELSPLFLQDIIDATSAASRTKRTVDTPVFTPPTKDGSVKDDEPDPDNPTLIPDRTQTPAPRTRRASRDH